MPGTGAGDALLDGEVGTPALLPEEPELLGWLLVVLATAAAFGASEDAEPLAEALLAADAADVRAVRREPL